MFFLLSWMNAAEMAVLSGFWQTNGLGTSGVKIVTLQIQTRHVRRHIGKEKTTISLMN